MRTVYNWLDDRPDIAVEFARARKIGGQHVLHRITQVAEGPGDDADSSVRVSRDRLRMDNLRYLAGLYDPDLAPDRNRNGPGSVTVTVITGVPQPDTPHRVTIEPAAPQALPAPPAELGNDATDEADRA